MEVLLKENQPVYCDFYKNLLVEELSLCEYPHLLHYGKCSVIGITTCCDSGLYSLKNIRMNCIDRQLQIPNGTTGIVLLDTLVSGKIPVNRYCEVFGEAVLYDTIDDEANILPKTSKDLMVELLALEATNSSDYLNSAYTELAKRYLPAIRVDSFNIIEQASELIECNLMLRCLKMDRRWRMNPKSENAS